MSGVGWPNGEVNNADVLALPGPLLILSPEHWHVREAQKTHKVLYRVVPPLAERPAVLGWNYNAYCQMIREQVHGLPITDLIPWNELDLNYERGDNEDDLDESKFYHRYRQIADFARGVLSNLRLMYPGVKIHWPAFTPDKDHKAIVYSDVWKSIADQFDVIDFHAYDNLANVQHEYGLYTRTFPDKLIALTEWHCKGDLEEESKVLFYTSQIRLESYFFIYRWDNAPEWWSEDYDIEHNPERYNLFLNWDSDQSGDPIMECPSIQQLKDYGHAKSIQYEVPWEYTERQFQQESGWQHCRSNGTIKISPSDARGVAQIKPALHPNVDVNDPWDSLDYAIKWISSMYQEFGSWKKAYAGYHDGPSFVRGYTKDGVKHEPWDGKRETLSVAGRRYLDVILGSDWDKEDHVPQFQFGFKDLADQLGHDVVGEPLTDEEYITPNISVQYTTTGRMEYSKVANKPYFFLAAR